MGPPPLIWRWHLECCNQSFRTQSCRAATLLWNMKPASASTRTLKLSVLPKDCNSFRLWQKPVGAGGPSAMQTSRSLAGLLAAVLLLHPEPSSSTCSALPRPFLFFPYAVSLGWSNSLYDLPPLVVFHYVCLGITFLIMLPTQIAERPPGPSRQVVCLPFACTLCFWPRRLYGARAVVKNAHPIVVMLLRCLSCCG